MLSASYVPPAFTQSVAAPIAAASRPTAGASATTKVEASFLSSMLGHMFTGVDAEKPFSGGAGEQAFRSFMTDAIATSMSKAGGVGLAKSVTAEMLKMQGLT